MNSQAQISTKVLDLPSLRDSGGSAAKDSAARKYQGDHKRWGEPISTEELKTLLRAEVPWASSRTATPQIGNQNHALAA